MNRIWWDRSYVDEEFSHIPKRIRYDNDHVTGVDQVDGVKTREIRLGHCTDPAGPSLQVATT